MNYTQEQFVALVQEVEDQGGQLTDEACTSRHFSLSGDKLPKGVTLPGCGNTAILEVPYEVPGKGGTSVMQTAKFCAVDDEMGKWPRFAQAVREA